MFRVFPKAPNLRKSFFASDTLPRELMLDLTRDLFQGRGVSSSSKLQNRFRPLMPPFVGSMLWDDDDPDHGRDGVFVLCLFALALCLANRLFWCLRLLPSSWQVLSL